MKKLAVALALALTFLVGCKRNVPVALSISVSDNGGCAELKPNPKFGKHICWGPGFAATKQFPNGDPSRIWVGPKKTCGLFGTKLQCWEGDGAPVDTGIEGDPKMKVAMGPNHFCATSGERFQCQGSNDEGQFGTEAEWTKYPIKLVTAGEASTCIAWEEGGGVVCRGRGVAKESLLVGSILTDLRQGPNHTCAVTKQGRLYCWGKNDIGQLGDGTTNNADKPVIVTGLEGVIGVAVGARHTCAHLGNRTVHCWGSNDHHQLANGTTQTSTRPAMVLGALGVWEIQAAGDSTCVRLGQTARSAAGARTITVSSAMARPRNTLFPHR